MPRQTALNSDRWRLPGSEWAKTGEIYWIVIELNWSSFDGISTGDIGYDNVHPALIAFLNIINVPVLPAPAFGFASGNTRGRFFHISDALRSRQRRTLMDGDMKR
jgi:hypothetical protein